MWHSTLSRNVLTWVYFNFARLREKCESIQNDSRRTTLFRCCARCVNIWRCSVICDQSLLLSCDNGFQRECYLMSKVVVREKGASWNSPFHFEVRQQMVGQEQNLKLIKFTLDRYYYLNCAFWCFFGDQK